MQSTVLCFFHTIFSGCDSSATLQAPGRRDVQGRILPEAVCRFGAAFQIHCPRQVPQAAGGNLPSPFGSGSYLFASSSVISSQVTPFSAMSTII